MSVCKKRLAIAWFIGAGMLFFIILVQTLLGRYEDKASEAWSWLLPTIMPTLSLISAVLVMDTYGRRQKPEEIDGFLYKLTLWLSISYISAVLLVIFLQPFSSLSPFALMTQSSLWLGPFQGLVTATMGAFFVQGKTR